LRALTEAIPDMMFRITRDGTYVDFEPASGMEPLVPLPVPRRRIDQIVPPEVARRAMLAVESAVATREPQAFEYALEMDGSERSYEARVVAAGEDDLVCLVRDVTGRKRAEQTLLETSRQLTHRVADLEALLDIVPVGVAIADDPACRRIRANRELSRILRLAPGVNASSTAPAGERPAHFTMTRNGVPIPGAELPMQVAARTGQPVLHSQIDIVFDDGSITSIYGQTTPLFAPTATCAARSVPSWTSPTCGGSRMSCGRQTP
jgi:PAS domain-containing protein